jgi:molybdate-binding protein
VELLRGLADVERTIVAIGSHDLVLDLAASALRASDPLITLASSNVGSLGGLVALRDGLCHLAGSHLLDPATGEYTLPYLDRIFGTDAELAVVRLVHRDQGLLVAPGNPLGLTGIADLTRPDLRYVNRQRGAGTRVLLDQELGRLGVDPATISGYSREEHTHLGVAAAVAAAGPTPAWAYTPPPGRSRWTSSRSRVSPTTWCCGPSDWMTRCSPRCGLCWSKPTSAPRWRSWAATRAPRPAGGSASVQ